MQKIHSCWLLATLSFLLLHVVPGHSLAANTVFTKLPVFIKPPPDTFTATLTLSDSIVCPGECVRLTITTSAPGVTTTIMVPADAQPDPTQAGVLCFPKPGTYTVTLQAEKAGDSTQLVSQTLKVMAMSDLFPNAFTPNGDGVNDTYQPLFRCPVIMTNFAIYNRWGAKVFSSNDPQAAWDGMVNGEPAPSDVYGWRLEYEALRDNQRQTFTENGQVNLLR